MPVRIRLARHGRKSRPYYYIVAADSRAPRDGKFIERIGSYNPMTNPASIDLDFDKALSWIQKGAQPSDTARAILKDQGVLYKNHLLKGVKKGAFTEEQAEEKYQTWLKENEDRAASVVKKLDEAIVADKKSRLEAEIKIREAMAAELAKRNADLASEAEAAVEEVVEEVAEEAAEEVVAEAAPEVVAEVTPEAAPEVVPEVVAETAPEVVAEAAPEVAEEAPVEEAVAETPAKEEPAAEEAAPKEEK